MISMTFDLYDLGDFDTRLYKVIKIFEVRIFKLLQTILLVVSNMIKGSPGKKQY